MADGARTRRPEEYVAERVRLARKHKGWNQAQLVARLNELGFTTWRQSKVAKLEKGTVKRLTIEEVLALAAALDVQPIHLLVGEGEVEVAPTLKRSAVDFRAWLRGELPLVPGDVDAARVYFAGTLVPAEETERGALNLLGFAGDLEGLRKRAGEIAQRSREDYERWAANRRTEEQPGEEISDG